MSVFPAAAPCPYAASASVSASFLMASKLAILPLSVAALSFVALKVAFVPVRVAALSLVTLKVAFLPVRVAALFPFVPKAGFPPAPLAVRLFVPVPKRMHSPPAASLLRTVRASTRGVTLDVWTLCSSETIWGGVGVGTS